MSAPLEQSRIDVLQAAAAALSATTTKGRTKARTALRPAPDSFLKAYYHLVATEELIARDPAELAATALRHREFAQSRPVGTSNIRVANPDVGANGKEATSTSVDIVVDDMPFLVDSVVSALGGFDRGVRSIVHPQMNVTRTVTGELVEVLTDRATPVPDDVALIQRVLDAPRDRPVARRRHPGGGGAAASRARERPRRGRGLAEDARPRPHHRERAQGRDAAGNRARTRRVRPADSSSGSRTTTSPSSATASTPSATRTATTSRGRCRAPGSDCFATTDRTPAPGVVLTPAASRAARDSTILIITKANSRATVHRDVYLDYISIKQLQRPGRVRRRAALPRPLRFGRLQRHDPRHPAARRAGPGRAAPHRAQRRQPLGQGHPPDPRDLPARRALPDEPGAAGRDRDERAAPAGASQDQALHCAATSSAASSPASSTSRATATTRRCACASRRILLEAFGGETIDNTTRVSESTLARLHFVVRMPSGVDIPDVDEAAVERRVIDATRTWDEDLSEALGRRRGVDEGARTMAAYAKALPEAYKEDFDVEIGRRRPRPHRGTRRRRPHDGAPPLPGPASRTIPASGGSSSTDAGTCP